MVTGGSVDVSDGRGIAECPCPEETHVVVRAGHPPCPQTRPVVSARATAGPAATSSLAFRLRRDTAALHAEVEEVADLPGSVASWADYRDLLEAFEGAWTALSAVAGAPTWSAHWAALGVRPAGAHQLDQIRADLVRLGSVPVRRGRGDPIGASPPGPGGATALRARSDEQLGQLYVLEGSALGRRALAPLLVARLGDIPVSFFLDDARHPHGWRALQSALQTVDDDQERHDDVVRGASTAFQVFLTHLRHRRCAVGSAVGSAVG